MPRLPRITDAAYQAHRGFAATLGNKPTWDDFPGAA